MSFRERMYFLAICMAVSFDAVRSAESDRDLNEIEKSVEHVLQNSPSCGTDTDTTKNITIKGLEPFLMTGNLSHFKPGQIDAILPSFHLYTRDLKENPSLWKLDDDIDSFAEHLQLGEKVYFICHGYGGKVKSKWMQIMKERLLDLENSNVILIDWSKGARSAFLPYPKHRYRKAAGNARTVARIAAKLVVSLNTTLEDFSLDKIHFIGHSLGAQVGGFFGQDIISMTNSKIGRITGLDPAGPLFTEYDIHLKEEHASFVDVIHSTSYSGTLGIAKGRLGMKKALGHVDFYPSGGTKQPGCKSLEYACSHKRAHAYYISSLVNCTYVSLSCQDFASYESEDCQPTNISYMGHFAILSEARGIFYNIPSASEPFCQEQKLDNNTPLIIGGATGGAFILAVGTVASAFLYRRRRKSKKSKQRYYSSK